MPNTNTPVRHVLLVEDDEEDYLFTKELLEELEGTRHELGWASDYKAALEASRSARYDVCLVDYRLGPDNGIDLARTLIAEGHKMPVILLTARSTPEDVVTGLDSGADDYLSKPFRLAELLARVRLRLRPVHTSEVFVLTYGDLRLDLRTRQAQAGGRTVDLSAREYALAEVLLRHPGQVLSREQLLSHVWGYDYDPGSNVVEVYIRYLRNKIGAGRIATVRGIGYRLTQPAPAAAAAR